MKIGGVPGWDGQPVFCHQRGQPPPEIGDRSVNTRKIFVAHAFTAASQTSDSWRRRAEINRLFIKLNAAGAKPGGLTGANAALASDSPADPP